jgi:transposase-like protein
MKGEIAKLILQTISENPENLYDSLEVKGYPRSRAYASIGRLLRWNYIKRVGKAKFSLTDRGKAKLNRYLYGLTRCPMCGSIHVRLNGKRNGTGHQRYLCVSCHFTFTQTCKEEAIMRALKKKKRVIFILHTSERFAYPILQKLRDWLKSDELGYLAKDIALIVP